MDYRPIIESKYNRENWQKLLHDIFGNKIKFWNTPSTIPTSSQFAKQAGYYHIERQPDHQHLRS